jgi:hypothetical protein
MSLSLQGVNCGVLCQNDERKNKDAGICDRRRAQSWTRQPQKCLLAYLPPFGAEPLLHTAGMHGVVGFSGLGSQGTPHILELLLLTLRIRQVLRESLRRKLDHSRCAFHVSDWSLAIEDAQNIWSSNTGAGNFGREEGTFTKRRVGLDVQVFIALCVSASSWSEKKCE